MGSLAEFLWRMNGLFVAIICDANFYIKPQDMIQFVAGENEKVNAWSFW